MTVSVAILKSRRGDAYVDIIFGIGCFIIYFGIVAMLFGVTYHVPLSEVVPLSQVVINSSEPTVGDYAAILLVATYGLLWGMRLIIKGITTVRFCNEELAKI